MSLPETSSPSHRWVRWAPAWLLGCAVLPYIGTWSYGFIDYDDEFTIVRMPLIRTLSLRALPSFFEPHVYPSLPEYMPLKNLSYGIDYALFGLSAPGFRVQQQLWYVACVLASWWWLRRLLRVLAARDLLRVPASWAGTLAFATSVLFALHPVHVESVTWLSGRKDLLCGAFTAWSLGSAAAFAGASSARGGAMIATLIATALALLSKPTAVMLPALLLLQDAVCVPEGASLSRTLGKRWPLYVTLFALAGAFSIFYLDLARPFAARASDPQLSWRLYSGPAWSRWGQQLLVLAWLSFDPTRLTPVLPPTLLDPHPWSARSVAGVLMLVVLALLGGFALRKRHPLALAVGSFALPVAPMLAAPAWAQYVAGRYLFHAVVGACFALVWFGAWLVHRRPRLRPIAPLGFALLCLFFAAATAEYNQRWRSSLSLWLGSTDLYPSYTELYDKAAQAAIREGKADLAAGILARCLERVPEDRQCALSLGSLMIGNYPETGEKLLRRGLPVDVTGKAHELLARELASRGRAKEAFAVLSDGYRNRPLQPHQLQALAQLALHAGEPQQALRATSSLLRALAQHQPSAEPPRQLLGELAVALRPSDASEALVSALDGCHRVDCVLARLQSAGVH